LARLSRKTCQVYELKDAMTSTVTLHWSHDLRPSPCALSRTGEIIFAAINAADQSALHAFALDGRELWSCPFEQAIVSGIETFEVSETSKVLMTLSSTDLLRREGMILTLNKDGQEAWRWTGSVQKVSAPTVVDDSIYFTADGKTLLCLNAETGREHQRWPLPGTASSAAPLIADDVAYIASRGPQVLALHFDGRVLWQYTHDDPAAWLDQRPVAIGNLLVVVSSQGEALALDRQTGALQRRAAIGSTGKSLSAPAADGTRVFIGARDGLYVLDVQTGRVDQWLQTERRVEAAPVIAGDVVYVTCHDHHLYALDRATGRESWRWAAAQRIELPPLVVADQALIVVAAHAGHVTVLERPLNADELAARGRWREAAEQYAADQHGLPQAAALTEYARQLEHERRLEEAGSIWEQAAQIFSAENERDRMQNCQREAARCRQQPILSVDVKYGGLRQDEWSQLNFSVTNIGFGPARNVIIHAEGDQFEGQVMATRSITTLPVGRSQIDQLDVKPRAVGRVPLRLNVEYADRTGAFQSFNHTLYVDVTSFTATTARSGGIDINAQNVTIYGDVIGRDKTSATDEKTAGPHEQPSAPLSSEEAASLQRQLHESRENLRLIEERKTEYVLEVDVSLQLVKEERRLRDKIAELEGKLRG
jgi:outer membrane protein assembly factor BamB